MIDIGDLVGFNCLEYVFNSDVGTVVLIHNTLDISPRHTREFGGICGHAASLTNDFASNRPQNSEGEVEKVDWFFENLLLVHEYIIHYKIKEGTLRI